MRRMLGLAPKTMEGKSRVGGGKKIGERGAGKFLRGTLREVVARPKKELMRDFKLFALLYAMSPFL